MPSQIDPRLKIYGMVNLYVGKVPRHLSMGKTCSGWFQAKIVLIVAYNQGFNIALKNLFFYFSKKIASYNLERKG